MEELEGTGLALQNIQCLPQITVAGGVATGSHGIRFCAKMMDFGMKNDEFRKGHPASTPARVALGMPALRRWSV